MKPVGSGAFGRGQYEPKASSPPEKHPTDLKYASLVEDEKAKAAAKGSTAKLAANPEIDVDSLSKGPSQNGAQPLTGALAPDDHYQPSFCLDISIPKHLKDAVMASE